MKIDKGCDLKFTKFSDENLFSDMEEIDKIMKEKMDENKRKEQESIRQAMKYIEFQLA